MLAWFSTSSLTNSYRARVWWHGRCTDSRVESASNVHSSRAMVDLHKWQDGRWFIEWFRDTIIQRSAIYAARRLMYTIIR